MNYMPYRYEYNTGIALRRARTPKMNQQARSTRVRTGTGLLSHLPARRRYDFRKAAHGLAKTCEFSEMQRTTVKLMATRKMCYLGTPKTTAASLAGHRACCHVRQRAHNFLAPPTDGTAPAAACLYQAAAGTGVRVRRHGSKLGEPTFGISSAAAGECLSARRTWTVGAHGRCPACDKVKSCGSRSPCTYFSCIAV